MDFSSFEWSDFRGIGTLLALLILLLARRRKKEAEAREQDVREYEPIEPEGSSRGLKFSNVMNTVSRAYSIIVVVAIIAAGLYTAEFEQDGSTHWIILGVFAVIALIYLVKKAKESDVTPDFNPDDPWEE